MADCADCANADLRQAHWQRAISTPSDRIMPFLGLLRVSTFYSDGLYGEPSSIREPVVPRGVLHCAVRAHGLLAIPRSNREQLSRELASSLYWHGIKPEGVNTGQNMCGSGWMAPLEDGWTSTCVYFSGASPISVHIKRQLSVLP